MKKYFLLIVFFVCSWFSQAQVKKIIIDDAPIISNGRFNERDTLPEKFIAVKIIGKTHFTDYKIISHFNDTTYVDTTLTIQKEYKHNFRLKDNFELMPFGNMGQTFNRLGYDFNSEGLFPILGATAKRFDFYAVEDVNYYRVPTPTTIFTHKTGFQQGQILNTLLTMNTSERLNYSLAFKGLRSLGFYRNELSSHGHFTFTINYETENDKYSIRGHMVTQDLINNENGGILDSDISNFESGDPQFTQRSRIDVNLDNATSVLRANRYYFEQDYKLWQKKDTVNHTSSHLRVGHVLNYQLEHYEFDQSFATSFFGDASGNIKDKLLFKKTYNQLFVALKAPIVLGEVAFKLENYNYEYGHTPDTTNTNLSPVSLKGNTVAIGGTWKAQLKHFYLNADVSNIVTGPLSGNRLKAEAILKKDSVYNISAGVLIASKSPNFNFLLYQSAYNAYNWQNDFKNERYKNIHFSAKTTKYGSVEVQFTNIDNYTFFGLPDATTLQTKPEQATESISYFKIKVSKEFKKGKFALNNTIMFNNVSSGSNVFRVPSFVTRNTFYYSDFFFEGKPLFLQIGVTLKYFSSYYANSFNPLLNEFSLQNDTKIGAFPMIDFFMNAQIQRTRLFLKVEHLNSGFTGYNFYSAPNYPFRDLSVRFGLVWNFFI